MLLDLSLARHLLVIPINPFHVFLRILQAFGSLLSILILRAAFLISKKTVYCRRIGPVSAPFVPYILNVRLCVLCVLNVLNVRAS